MSSPLVALATTQEDLTAERTRTRPQPVKLEGNERQEIVDRVLRFFREDDQAREGDKRLREQRYAKLMQFEQSQRIDGGSNMQLSDIMAVSLRMEDQIQNSVMSTRPIINSRARLEVNRQRERKTDLMLDQQFFVEQDGEGLIETLTTNFFRDGMFVTLTHWVREFRKVMYTRHWEPIPFGVPIRKHFESILLQAYGKGSYREVKGSDGWDWDLYDEGGEKYLARFYTDDDGVVLEVQGEPIVFNGPCVLPYDYEDVLAPLWSLNLQPPGPSNPHGAPHVILVDYPTRDEIIRGVEQGYYDLIEMSDLDGIEGFRDWSDGDRELARQRHELRGQGMTYAQGDQDDGDHRQLRRMLCFDVWRGLDVVWWVLDGPGLLLRARPLTEMCPGLPPRRPIAHAACFGVQGTWLGMGIPELMESNHDFMTCTFNQMVDAASLELQPFFTYRQSSNLKPEDIVLGIGVGIPTQNPQADIVFQRVAAQATQIGVNLITLAERLAEKLTSVGDLQVGQIPTGKSAALRTSSGIQQVLAQGEARPERMLRRFFGGLRQIFEHMYQLDRHFLPDEKKFRAVGVARPEEDPIVAIDRVSDLGETHFEFGANVLNSSKVALQSALNEMLTLMANPLMLQTGIAQPDGIYRVLVDYFAALGQNAEKYVSKPTPQAANPPILAAEALTAIMQGLIPAGPPAEGDFQLHIQSFTQLLGQPGADGIPLAAALSPQEKERAALYLQTVQQQALQAQQQMAMMAAAQQFQAARQQMPSSPGGGDQPAQPIVQKNEAMDESMPAGTGTPQ